MKHYSATELSVRTQIVQAINQALAGVAVVGLDDIAYPPNPTMGDYTVACFPFAKALGKAPTVIAADIAKAIQPSAMIAGVQAAGPYVNFTLAKSAFADAVIREVLKKQEQYGAGTIGRGKKVMIEYFSPNTNKQLTVGHVRNTCLGWSIARIMKFLGYKVIEATLYNDRGIAIAKAIVGYQKWGEGKTPDDVGVKPDHYVGSFYVRFSQAAKEDKQLEHEAQVSLQAWEKGDSEVRGIWQQLMTWVYQGFDQTLTDLGIGAFDQRYYESEYYHHAKEIIDLGLKKGVFKQHPEGYVYVDLEKHGLPNKILLRSDGTSLYITQDIYLASLKNRHKLDESMYVVGSEQDLQFKQLFKILELLKFENIKTHYHVSYGMVRLPWGKIKSREGIAKGTSADDLLAELRNLATKEISQRFPDTPAEELQQRAKAIALGALKFYMLSVRPDTTLIFNPETSIAFTGRTGPYIQYTHARINSILQKAEMKVTLRGAHLPELTSDHEQAVIKLLAQFPGVLAAAATEHDPSRIADYLFEVSKMFSALYEQVPILQAEPPIKRARLALCVATQHVLANGLTLLGIEPMQRM